MFLLQFCSLLLQSYVVMLFESVYYIGYYTCLLYTSDAADEL